MQPVPQKFIPLSFHTRSSCWPSARWPRSFQPACSLMASLAHLRPARPCSALLSPRHGASSPLTHSSACRPPCARL